MTRGEVATYLAGRVGTAERAQAVQAAAAWLVSSGRTAEVRYLANDVAAVAATNGYTTAIITTARPAESALIDSTTEYLKRHGANQVELATTIDPELIGGSIVTTPTETLDLSIRRALATLSQGDIL